MSLTKVAKSNIGYRQYFFKSITILLLIILLFPNEIANASEQTVLTSNHALENKFSVGKYRALATWKDGTVEAWGSKRLRITVPQNLNSAVAVAAGNKQSLALQENGKVFSWGFSSSIFENLTDVVAISAGTNHHLALTRDGKVHTAGDAWSCDPVLCKLPNGLNDVVAISAGSTFSLALKSNGSVVGWGYNNLEQIDIPNDVEDIIAVEAGGSHALALKSDGTVIGWGANKYKQATPPKGLKDVIAIAAGDTHSLALKSDGTVVAWGSNFYGERNLEAVKNKKILAIWAGYNTTFALEEGGKLIAWGDSVEDVTQIPRINMLKYAVKYIGNGNISGNVPLDEQYYNENDLVYIKELKDSLVRPGYTLVGWNTMADGTGIHYTSGSTFPMGNHNVTLYAQWEPLSTVDLIAPVTKYKLDPIYAQAKNGTTYVRGFNVSLKSEDNEGGSGPAIIMYKINNGAWKVYNSPFTIISPTVELIEYYSIDLAGNRETVINKMDFIRGRFTGAGPY